MNKQDFLDELSQRLAGLQAGEIADIIQYYSEYFDEAGIENEERTLSELGSAADIAKRLLAQSRAVQAGAKPQDSSGGWEEASSTNGQKLSAFQRIDVSAVAESVEIKHGSVYSIEILGDTSVIGYRLEGDTLRVWRIKNFFMMQFRSTRVIITIPERTRLEECRTTAVSASLKIAVDANEIFAKTTSGSIEINGSCRKLTMSSVSGSVSAIGEADDLDAKTTSGAIRAEGKIGDIRASSVSGSIKIKLANQEQDYTMHLSSVSGAISAGCNRLRHRAEIGSGNLMIDAKTTSGAIKIEFGRGGSAQ